MRERVVPEHYRRQMAEAGGSQQFAKSLRIFEGIGPNGEWLRALVSRNPSGTLRDGRADVRWHISVSVRGKKRLPTWEELKLVRQALRPEVFFVVGLPPEKHWMNYGEVLHLTETKDENLIQQWIAEGERAKEDARLGIGYGATLESTIDTRRKKRPGS